MFFNLFFSLSCSDAIDVSKNDILSWIYPFDLVLDLYFRFIFGFISKSFSNDKDPVWPKSSALALRNPDAKSSKKALDHRWTTRETVSLSFL